MNYIKAAVELADGWRISKGGDVHAPIDGWPEGFLLPEVGPFAKDALAAQLVRQVDALDGYFVGVGCEFDEANRAAVYGPKFKACHGYLISDESGPDRTMNTIKAIVDSGVLVSTEQEGEI